MSTYLPHPHFLTFPPICEKMYSFPKDEKLKKILKELKKNQGDSEN